MTTPQPSGSPVNTIPGSLAVDTEVGWYRVTPAEVMDLLPHVTLTDGAGDDPAAGVTLGAVARWIVQLSGTVHTRLAGLALLKPSYRETTDEAAHAAVVNAVASYVAAATHGTDAGFNSSTYSEVLWNRYTAAVEALGAQVDAWARPGGPEEASGEGAGDGIPNSGAGWYFPPATVQDGARW